MAWRRQTFAGTWTARKTRIMTPRARFARRSAYGSAVGAYSAPNATEQVTSIFGKNVPCVFSIQVRNEDTRGPARAKPRAQRAFQWLGARSNLCIRRGFGNDLGRRELRCGELRRR